MNTRSKRDRCDRLITRMFKDQSCAICMRVPTVPHHIISRTHANTRHNPANILPLCFACHRKAHDKPAEFTVQLNSLFPKRMEWVEQHRHDTGKPDYDDALMRLKAFVR